MTKHMFSECEVIEQKNRSKGLIDRPIYIPNASKTNSDIIVVNNKIQILHSNCKKCGTKLETKIWQYLGICAMCEMQ